MSLKVAVVCEDHVNDQYLAKPVVEKLLSIVGKPTATVRVVTNPRLHGYTDLRTQACSLLARYGAIADIVIFVVDADGRDGQGGRPNREEDFFRLIASCTAHSKKGVVVAAIQEIEVWALWGKRTELGRPWASIRSEQHPKEVYFEPMLTADDRRRPDGGRTRLIAQSLGEGWVSLAAGCPELANLEKAISVLLQSH